MERFDFVFVYEVKARELDNICLIASQLENMGYSVAFLNSWYCLAYPEEKKRYRCNVLVISAGYDTASIKYFAEHVVDYKYIVNLQWEQVMTKSTLADPAYRWNFKGVARQIAHINWGQWNYNILHDKCEIPSKDLCIGGHVSLDFFRKEFDKFFITKQQLFKRYGLDKYSRVSLFISSFTLVNQRKSYLEQAAVEQDIGDKVELSEQSQQDILQWFKKYLIDNPDKAMVYRPHPAEVGSEWLAELSTEIENFHVISELPIKPWIKHSDVIYTWISTSIGEIWASGCSCYILRPLPMPSEKDMIIYEDAVSVTDYQGFLKTQEEQEYSFPIAQEVMQHFYRFEDDFNYNKIAEFLSDCIKQGRVLDKKIKAELFADINYQKRENSLYGTFMDFIAMNTPLPFSNFEQRRKTYDLRMENKGRGIAQPDEHTMEKIKQNYASPEEISEIKTKIKALL